MRRRHRRGDEEKQIARQEEGGESGDHVAEQQQGKEGEKHHAEELLAQNRAEVRNSAKIAQDTVEEPEGTTPEQHNQCGQDQRAHPSAAV